MYVTLLKNRTHELSAAKKLSDCFGDKLIPYFEIIQDEYRKIYIKDEAGEYITQPKVTKTGKTRNMRVLAEPREKDIITLDNINKIINGKVAFIDFFRFSIPEKEYPDFAIDKVLLAYKLSHEFNYYEKRIFELKAYSNFIPVLSIKKGLELDIIEFRDLIRKMQTVFPSIAVRVTSDVFLKYKNELEHTMRSTDYLFFDIRKKPARSMVIEFMKLKNILCKKILLNSPRPIDKKNGDYEKTAATIYINNEAVELYGKSGFDGVGDFSGLKDELPKEGGARGLGTALSLLYNYQDNKFYSFKNDDVKDGLRGYKNVVSDILGNVGMLGENTNCIALNHIRSMPKTNAYGNWGTWNELTILRYIHQQFLKQNKN